MKLVRRNSDWFFPSLINDFFNDEAFDNRLAKKQRFNTPAVNISKSEDEFTVALAAPGLSKENFSINVEKHVLTIKAEVSNEHTEEGTDNTYTLRQFGQYSFSKSFRLPETVNEDAISASYENGILNVTLPVSEEAKPSPKAIEIA
ncbi:MAG: Hsp20/alpha crystallin family protein [Bacteroidota bacterium]